MAMTMKAAGGAVNVSCIYVKDELALGMAENVVVSRCGIHKLTHSAIPHAHNNNKIKQERESA